MSYLILLETAYLIIVTLVCLRIIYDTQNPSKTWAYLFLVIFAPFVGIFIYFSFGINYRKRKIYKKTLFHKEMEAHLYEKMDNHRNYLIENNPGIFSKYSELIQLGNQNNYYPVLGRNRVKLLINGENKFPNVLKAIQNAKHHIHLEYYIYEWDNIGIEIIEILKKKASEGVKVRFIYDDFGSYRLNRRRLQELRDSGIEAYPFYKVQLLYFANRLNYRNHRKIIVIDGKVGFVGGINVSDKYINSKKNELYWRDTHLRIEGLAVSVLQYTFLVDWNYCSGQKLKPDQYFFPKQEDKETKSKLLQIVGSGPDSEVPLIMETLCKAINLAKKEVLITNPYFIPDETVKNTLIMAAKSGINVKLLLPGISDSKLVKLASNSFMGSLLKAGVEVYLYQKGFVHAKTMVIDRDLAIIGTANMDIRSFDLNFEINAMVYDRETAIELTDEFYKDLNYAEPIDSEKWQNRPVWKLMLEKMIRLFSPMM